MYIASALLVAPAVFAATGERIGGEAPDARAGGSYDGRLERSIRDIVAYGGSRPDFRDGGPLSAKVWANSISLKFNKILTARLEHLHRMLDRKSVVRERV